MTFQRISQTGITEPPATFLPALVGINTVRKYLINVAVNDTMMAMINSTENEVQSSAESEKISL
jgi:hypothetical protein